MIGTSASVADLISKSLIALNVQAASKSGDLKSPFSAGRRFQIAAP
jgi:hypothetical protein